MKTIGTLLFTIILSSSFGQDQVFEVNNTNFVIESTVQKNEWHTKDSLNKLYRLEGQKKIHVLDYYIFKDEGGDCNNLFWEREYLQLEGDSIIFRTAYFQKTNMDPIPTERKQIYKVADSGKLELVFDKYRYRHSSEWVDLD